MNVQVFLGLIVLYVSYGCSSSSNSTGNVQTFRLASEQTSFVDGRSSEVTYEYDQEGNLIGWVSDNRTGTYNIDTDGRIIDAKESADGIPLLSTQLYYYDTLGRLRRIDNLGAIEGVGVIGVSFISVYEFTNDLATSLELRIIPFDDIVPNGQVDDSAGFVSTKIVFEYDDGRLVRELVDTDGDDAVDRQRDYTYNSDGTLSSAMDTGGTANFHVYSYEQGECNLNWGNSTHDYFCVVINGM